MKFINDTYVRRIIYKLNALLVHNDEHFHTLTIVGWMKPARTPQKQCCQVSRVSAPYPGHMGYSEIIELYIISYLSIHAQIQAECWQPKLL